MLALLAERQMHGYEMISELGERTGGHWRPSPGSVYPTLQALEDEGLVTARAEGGRRSYTLTDAGRGAVAESGPAAPWDEVEVPMMHAGADDLALRQAAGQLIAAVDQVLLVGTPEQRARVAGLLDEARRAVYRILAES